MFLKYFKLSEFNCPCCQENNMKEEFLDKIDIARGFSWIPYIINSGYRCTEHNKNVGGSLTSSHLKGLATDIKVMDDRERFRILLGLIQAGFMRIEIGLDYIHADIDKDKDQQICWLHPKLLKK